MRSILSITIGSFDSPDIASSKMQPLMYLINVFNQIRKGTNRQCTSTLIQIRSYARTIYVIEGPKLVLRKPAGAIYRNFDETGFVICTVSDCLYIICFLFFFTSNAFSNSKILRNCKYLRLVQLKHLHNPANIFENDHGLP